MYISLDLLAAIMTQNKAIILIGAENSGKTGTIDEWCRLKGKTRLAGGRTTFVTKINGKDEFVIISSSSVQEQKRYDLEKVKKELLERIARYEVLLQKEGHPRFVWVMAFTVGVKKGIVKTDVVEQAIGLLESEGLGVLKVYIKRADLEKFAEIDDFINSIKDKEIISNEDYQRQSRELDGQISHFV